MTISWERLRRPFEPSQIRQREGKKGMWYDYVPNSVVIERLNEQMDLRWNFTVKHEIIGNEVLVLGTLQIGNEVKEAFGSCKYEQGGIGDALKTAQSGALTKAASLFGIPCVFNSRKIDYTKQNYNQANQQTYKQTNNYPKVDQSAHPMRTREDSRSIPVPFNSQSQVQNNGQKCVGVNCGKPMSDREIKYCNDKLNGEMLCISCQRKRNQRGA